MAEVRGALGWLGWPEGHLGCLQAPGVQGDAVRAGGKNYATVAYVAATGARLRARLCNGPANDSSSACSIAVSPSGRRAFVTGSSRGATSGAGYATIGYRG